MRDDNYLEKSVMSGWHFLTGDVSFSEYGGKWYKQLDDTVYHVIELINMWDATGEENQPKYNVGLQEIDLQSADIDSALQCCGIEFTSDGIEPVVIVDAISAYGQYAPMGNWDGNSYRKLLLLAKRESSELSGDDYYHQKQLSRPVNKLGSSAREFARGDFQSALVRGIANDDKSARIMGKMYGLNNDDMDKIKDDPDLKQFSLWGDY